MNPSKTYGVIYDLDGTVLDSNQLNEDAWVHTLKPYGITPTREQFLFQRGRPGEVCSRYMLSDHLQQYANEVLRQQLRYVEERYGSVTVFSGFWETYDKLCKNDHCVSICTSAPPERIALLLDTHPEFGILQNNIICRGMYTYGKPSPEPLLVTAERMNLQPSQLIYIGDAESDYLCAVNAHVPFVYFHGKNATPDEKIPTAIPKIRDHRELIWLLS